MDPEFLAGSEHVAHAPVSNPTSVDWTYDAELYLVKDETKHATSGLISFSLAAGASDTVDFPITMPDTSGTYKVYLDVYVSSNLIAAYQATEDIIITGIVPEDLPPGFEIDYIHAEPSVVVLGNEMKFHIWWFCPNPELKERTFNLHCVVDGVTLQKSWGPTTRGNGAIDFFYTPPNIGTYTATVLDKSVSFEVVEGVVGPFYCPFGYLTPYETLDALANHIASAHTNNEYISCPYCDKEVIITSGQRIGAAYGLLDHIESVHPDHPLTEPECMIVLKGSLPTPTTGGIYRATYFLDGEYNQPFLIPDRYFVVAPGIHTVECYAIRVGAYPLTPSGEKLLDVIVDLANWGDKAEIDVGTGEVEYLAWE